MTPIEQTIQETRELAKNLIRLSKEADEDNPLALIRVSTDAVVAICERLLKLEDSVESMVNDLQKMRSCSECDYPELPWWSNKCIEDAEAILGGDL